jgi:hypothetical protein
VNASLAALLRDLARQLDGATADWHDAIVLQNYGAVPIARPGELPTLRGFNLLLLARDGTPRHFAKCRPLAADELARETALMRQLSASTEGRRHVPAVAMGVGPTFAAQLSPFLAGEPMQAWLRRAGPGVAEPAILEVLDVAGLLGRLLADLQPGPPSVALETAASPHLAAVSGAGLDSPSVERIVAVLRAAGLLPALLQHGDLWPPNVIRSRDAWLLLDFELFGRLAVPMVDAMQLVRASGDVLWPAADGASWIAALATDADRARFTRRLLDAARERLGLGGVAALGCSAFALLEITGRFLLAGRAEADWRPALRALQDFSALLAAGGPARAEAALFGGAA